MFYYYQTNFTKYQGWTEIQADTIEAAIAAVTKRVYYRPFPERIYIGVKQEGAPTGVKVLREYRAETDAFHPVE